MRIPAKPEPASIHATRGAEDVVEEGPSRSQWAVLLASAAFMLAVCLLAGVVPTHRGLRVEPTEALRAE